LTPGEAEAVALALVAVVVVVVVVAAVVAIEATVSMLVLAGIIGGDCAKEVGDEDKGSVREGLGAPIN